MAGIDVRVVAVPDLASLLDVPGARAAMGQEMQRVVQRAASGWPVDTGFSKDNFGFEVEDDAVILTNRADYAGYVEARTGAAENEVRSHLGRIADAGRKALTDG